MQRLQKEAQTMTGEVEVRMLQDTDGGLFKKGTTGWMRKEEARLLIENGFAEYVEQNKNALVINREHAQIHLAILGKRQKYLVTVNKHNEELEYNQIIPFTQEQNNKGFSVWVSLNPKNKDGTKGVTHLADFCLDIDRPKATKDNTRPATKEELQETLERARQLQQHIETSFNCIGFMALSGNGYHLHFPLPITPIADNQQEKVNSQVTAFAKKVSKKIGKEIDSAYDINRKTTLIGSFNLKFTDQPLQTAWDRIITEGGLEKALAYVQTAREQNKELLEAILSTPIEENKPVIDTTTTKTHPKLEAILNNNSKLKDYYNGDFQKHTEKDDRSEAEMTVICKLLMQGFTDEEIKEAMLNCQIGKWQKDGEAYQNHTLKKAHEFLVKAEAENQAKKQKETMEKFYELIFLYPNAKTAFDGDYKKHYKTTEEADLDILKILFKCQGKFKIGEIRYIMDQSKTGYWNNAETPQEKKDKLLVKAERQAKEEKEQNNVEDKQQVSQADLIVQLCEEEKIELFHDQHQKGYARFTCDIAIFNDNCDISYIVSKPPTHINLKNNTKCDSNKEEKSSVEGLGTIREIPQETAIPQLKTVVYPVSNKHFRSWLSLLMWKKKGKVPGSEALNSALNVLKGKAELEGKEYTLHNRVAPVEDGFYIDMCDDQWRAIKVTAEGWEIIENPPILFRRYTHQKPLTIPLKITEAEAAQKALKFLEYINLNTEEHETQLAVLITIITWFIPLIPHPILVVHGAQGTAKSYFFKIVRRIIDPSSLELLSIPKDARELVQILSHHWCCLFDNISYFSQENSDTICKAVTGGGLSKRELWTDDDDIIYSFKRCIGLNGINIVGSSSDLLDRSLLVELVAIKPENRKTEQEIDEQFFKDLPEILGAFLTILSCAIRLRPSINPKSKFRLADWTIWACAIAEALGKTQQDFMDAYDKKVKLQHEEAINSSTVALVLLEYCKHNIKVSSVKNLENKNIATWEGTATQLLKELSFKAENLGYNIKDKKSRWPKAANALSRSIQRASADLETIGISITTKEGTPRRIIIDATNIEREPTKDDKNRAVYEQIKPAEQCDFCRQNAVEFVTSIPSGDTLRQCEGCFKNLPKQFPELRFTPKEAS